MNTTTTTVTTSDEYLIKLLDELTTMNEKTGEIMEGNCYTVHVTKEKNEHLSSKRENLKKFAKNCSDVLEIGFNAGHSAAIFLHSNPYMTLTCVDIGFHKYTEVCYLHLKEIYGDRIQLIICDSKNMTHHLDERYYRKFDGVHVDGYHFNFHFVNDTMSVLKYLRDNALFIMDDVQDVSIQSWVNIMQNTYLFTKPKIEFMETEIYKHTILSFKRPSYAICTIAKGKEYCEKIVNCIKSKYEYARHYNYTLLTEDDFQIGDLHVAWSKIYLLKKYLKDYDYLFWIDADAMIMNMNVCLDNFFLCLPKQYNGLISVDVNGINSGVMLLKNCPEMNMMLENLPKMDKSLLYTGIYEQRPLMELLKLNVYPNLFYIVHQNIWNSYDPIVWCLDIPEFDGYREGDFIVHFAGYNTLKTNGRDLKLSDTEYGDKRGYFDLPFERFINSFLRPL